MKRKLSTICFMAALSAAALFVSSFSAFAHHSQSAYDTTKTITVKTTVARFEWTNPHCQIFFDAQDDKGNVQHWNLEMPPPSVQSEKGWTRRSLNPGDAVTIVFHPNKNGTSTGILVKLFLANGQELDNRP